MLQYYVHTNEQFLSAFNTVYGPNFTFVHTYKGSKRCSSFETIQVNHHKPTHQSHKDINRPTVIGNYPLYKIMLLPNWTVKRVVNNNIPITY